MTLTSKTPYIPLEQKPDLCFHAIIRTDINRRGVLYDLDSLAVYLGAYINEDNKDIYSPELQQRALPKDDARVGFLIDNLEKVETLEKLAKLGYEEFKLHRIGEFDNLKDVSDFITYNLGRNNYAEQDVAIGLNFRWDKIRGTKNGHYVLVAAYDNKSKIVTVCDTSFINNSFWTMHLSRFVEGMKSIYEEDDGKRRERGLFIASGPSKFVKIPGIEPENLAFSARPYIPHIYGLQRIIMENPKPDSQITLFPDSPDSNC